MNEETLNSRMEKVADIIENDPTLQDEQDTDTTATDPANVGNNGAEKPPTVEGQEKTSEADKLKPGAATQPGAIEPPVSWPSDDKEAFKSLPTWAQETISRRENEREAHFTERTRAVAERERGIQDVQRTAAEAHQKYTGELTRLNEIAQQLMPAKFSDIQSEADYLRLKVEDPQRAAEYEVFAQVLGNARQQAAEANKAAFQQKIDKEWETLQAKYPEFKDPVKGVEKLNAVRKAAVVFYGFTPQEVTVIADHRHVPIIEDAMKWRAYQANLKAAEGKKVPNKQPLPGVRQNGGGGQANLGAEEKNKLIKKAAGTSDLRKKADMLGDLIAKTS